MATVTANNTRVNDADANTDWGNYNSTGGSPAAEPQLKYQGTNAVNKKITTTGSRGGIDYDPGANAIDMTASGNKLWLCKVKVADAGDLNATYGVEVGLGSQNNAFYSYNIAGSSANSPQFTDGYSSQGGLAEGYLIVAIDPEIAVWREGTTGSPTLTAVDYYNVAAQFVTGGAKSENLAMDAIDVGRGLTYTGTAGVFRDAIDFDQGTDNNRFGYACAVGNAFFLRGVHTLGGSSSLAFDSDEVVFFPDGYHSADSFGILCDLTNASTDINFRGLVAGLGSNQAAEDTRPFLTASGTGGTCLIEGTFQDFRRIELSSVVTCSGAVGTETLVQGGATFENATINTLSIFNTATIVDPDMTKITSTDFVQASGGHAIEITTTGTYSYQDIGFQGYGGTGGDNLTPSSGPEDAAIYNNSGGLVTINVAGGDSPSVRNAASSTTEVNQSVTLTFTGLEDKTEIRIYEAGTTTELDGQESVTTGSFVYSFEGADAGNQIDVRIFNIRFQPVNFLLSQNSAITLQSTNQSIPVQQIFDRNYDEGQTPFE